MQAGQSITIRVKGACPDGSAHESGALALFYAPGRDPEHDPGDREPDRVLVLPFDPVTRTYGRDVATSGWQPGTWTLQGAVLGPDGQPEGWSWSRFPLDPLSPIRLPDTGPGLCDRDVIDLPGASR